MQYTQELAFCHSIITFVPRPFKLHLVHMLL